MSNEEPAGQPREHTPHRARRIIGGFLLSAAIVGGGVAVSQEFDHGNEPAASSSADNPSTPTASESDKPVPAGPVSIDQLPGFGQKVAAQQLEAVKASTVQVVRQKQIPGSDSFMETFCTGIKVEIDGQVYVATAGHCLVNEGKDTRAAFPGSGRRDAANLPSLQTAKEIPQNLSGKIIVLTIGSNGKPDARHPEEVDKAVAIYNRDFALFRVAQDNQASSSFAALPAVSYEPAVLSQPMPGSELALYGARGGVGFVPFHTVTGTYLGTSSYPGQPAKKMAWVRFNSGSVVEGNSGAIGVPGGAGNLLTGPESVSAMPHTAKEVAARLGVKLGPHSQVVGFDVVTQAEIEDAAQLAAAQ